MRDQKSIILIVIFAVFWYAWTNQQNDTSEEITRVDEEIKNWREKGNFFEFESLNIFYIDNKNFEKQNLLILHGFPTSSWDFSLIMPNITDRYRIVVFDMIGFGLSDKPNHFEYSLKKQADVALRLLSKLGINEFHVLAHDYGVSVAQELLARKQSEEKGSKEKGSEEKGSEEFKILSVAFLNGGLFASHHKALFTQKLIANPIIGPYVYHFIPRAGFMSSMKKIYGSPPPKFDIMVYWAFININNGASNMHKLLGYIQERKINEKRWADAVLNSTVPIRLINGPADPISGAHVVEYYKSVNKNPIGDAVLLTPDIGHYPQMEAPNQVVEQLFLFWNNLVLEK